MDTDIKTKKIDTTEAPDDSQVRGWYKKLMSSVYQIDDVLDAQADAASGGKRKFTNELVDSTKDVWSPVTDQLSIQLNEMVEEQRAGAFYGFVRTLSETFKEDIDKWITMQIESRPKVEVETISEDEKKKLQEDRSNFNKQIRAIIEMAYTFGEADGDLDDNPDPNWPMPKVRRGSVGKRGKRALTLFTWSIDGNEIDEDNDSTKGVATLLGFEKTAEFTQALRDAGVNTTTPNDTFTVEIRGKQVTGTRITEEDDAEEDVTEPADSEVED
jgi:hypothetical protein